MVEKEEEAVWKVEEEEKKKRREKGEGAKQRGERLQDGVD